MSYRAKLTGPCLAIVILLHRPDGIGPSAAHTYPPPVSVYTVRLATGIHSGECGTNLCVGDSGLADIAEACHVFYSGWKQRAIVPKNTDKIALDIVLIQDCADPFFGLPKNTNF